METIQVLHLITELNIGGAQKSLARLLAHLDQTRFAPTVACLYNGDGSVADEIRALGIPVTELGMTARWRLDAFCRLYRLLRRERPIILHTWMFHANLPGRVLGCLAGVPIVISSERTMGQEGLVRRQLNRLTAPLADQVVCVSQRVADFAATVIGIPSQKLLVIPNGIRLEDFQPGNKAEVRATMGISLTAAVIGTVGRLRPVKGGQYLIKAFAQLIPGYPEALLLVVGDGPQRARLESLAQQLGIARRVRFLGNRSDVPRLLQAMDIFALPSEWEGMPNAVLEAMAAGLPVIATAVGGTPEVVVNGVTGLLVPPRDPEALAQAIVHLLQDRDLRRKMGQAGRERVERYFSVERMVQATETLYETLIREKMGSA